MSDVPAPPKPGTAAPQTQPQAQPQPQPKPQTQVIELRVGMVAEVMSPDNRLIYVGKVDKIQSSGVCIREATDDTLPMVLVNKPVKVRFYRDEDNIVLHGKVCGSTMKMWKIDRLETTFSREKRGFFRQSISVDIEARCGKRNSKGGHPNVFFPCQVLDISAGGILISCSEVFIEGDRLMITQVPLVAGAPEFTFDCQVRRAGEWKRGVSRYGCQFTSLTPKDQDRLLQAIFTIQREEIRRRRARR